METESEAVMKTGPVEKIYEAYSAIADGRVQIDAQNSSAFVQSSDRRKTYSVRWEGKVYYSDDNATYWQGYAGYPVIAVLMKQGILPLKEETAALFSGINWNELNKRFKRDYAEAAASVMKERGLDTETIRRETEAILDSLKELDFELRRGKGKR